MTYQDRGRQVRLVVTDSDGVTRAFSYDRDRQELMSASVTQPDKSRISAFFTTYRSSEVSMAYRGLSELIMVRPGGYPKTEIFVNGKMEITGVMTVVGGEWPNYIVQGKMMWWDAQGNKVVDLDIEKPMAYEEAFALYTPEQLDALKVPATTRLESSKAFKQLPFELQRPLENVIGWSERFADAHPEELTKQAHGHAIVHADAGDAILYRVATDDDREWVFSYDKSTARPKSAIRGDLAIYFDYRDTGKVIGGRGTYREHPRDENGLLPMKLHPWLFSIYPIEVAPRMAVAVATVEPSEDVLVQGHLYVWSKRGDIVFESDIAAPTPLVEVIEGISTALTDDEKAAIGWRGAQEPDYLSGNY